jgi:hypothetical protein
MRFFWMMMVILVAVSGCGEGKNSSELNANSTVQIPQIQTYSLSGKARNIRPGTTVVLQNNKGDNISISAGATSFTFPTRVSTGASYNISIFSHPQQTCKILHGNGTASDADISDVILECTNPGNELTNNPSNDFIATLLLNNKFVVPANGRVKETTDADPSNECADKIESKKELSALNEKIKLEQINDSRSNKLKQKTIFLAVAELKKCKKLGDDWRIANYFPQIISLVDQSYLDVIALAIKLYTNKIGYTDYAKKNLGIHKSFTLNINAAIKRIGNQQTEASKLKEVESQKDNEKLRLESVTQQQEIEKQKTEKQQLEALAEERKKLAEERKLLAEEERLADLSVKQEELMFQAEVQRIKESEINKKFQLEQEKYFQRMDQRQQMDRMR